MRVIYMSLVNSIRKIKYYIIPVYLYRGKEKQSGMELNMAYLGWGEKSHLTGQKDSSLVNIQGKEKSRF
jgi:hypothetical protein